MAGRGRGRGRVFGRGKPFPSNDQLNPLPVEKATSAQHSTPYPPLEFFSADLVVDKDYNELFKIKEKLASHFQNSNYYLKVEDENAKLFSSQAEEVAPKKALLNFHWESFPLELRPTGKRKQQKCQELLANLRKNKMDSVDLSWLDKLEEKESDMNTDNAVVKESAKKESEDDQDENEFEEFDDEELDLDTDYNTTYFDNGEGFMDEDNDVDEGPCY